MTISLYGLKNCDSCRAARRWLDDHGVHYQFLDLRKQPPQAATVSRWSRIVGWTLLLNRRSTTWRALGETQRQVRDAEDACRLIHEYPALLKRPVLDRDGELLVGFKAGEYARFLG